MCFPPPIPRAKQVAVRRGRHHRKCGPVLTASKGAGPIIRVKKGLPVPVTKTVCQL
jgi:hypothetical protein